MDIITATTSQKPGSFVSDKPLAIEAPTAKQQNFIKWLATIPADGKKVKNGTIKPLDERIANLQKALKKHIIMYKACKSSAEKWGQVFAIKGLRRGLWLHLQALKLQTK